MSTEGRYVDAAWQAKRGVNGQDPNLKIRRCPDMHDDAYYGLTGDLVDAVSPHTEADPAAILIQFLTVAGNILGRSRYYQVEGDHHHANLFVPLVG